MREVNIAGAAAGLLRIGQIAEARRLGRLAVQLLPDDPRAWLVLAEAELRSSDENNRSEQTAKAEAAWLAPKNSTPKTLVFGSPKVLSTCATTVQPPPKNCCNKVCASTRKTLVLTSTLAMLRSSRATLARP